MRDDHSPALRAFHLIARYGSFTRAAADMEVTASALSQTMRQLEQRLGVRLLQRTTRRFVVTEVGERFYSHCRAVLEEARAAQDAVDELRTEPRGVVRVSCPNSLAQTIVAHVLPDFLAQYPKVQVRLQATNRRVDLIGEGVDLAIRVRAKLDTDATLVMRTFGQSRVLIVASPKLMEQTGRPKLPSDLSTIPALAMNEHEGAHSWELLGADNERVVVDIQPRLICGDFSVLLESARRGIGVTLLPEFVCAPAITNGDLEVLLPDWSVPEGTMHFVYPSRRDRKSVV